MGRCQGGLGRYIQSTTTYSATVNDVGPGICRDGTMAAVGPGPPPGTLTSTSTTLFKLALRFFRPCGLSAYDVREHGRGLPSTDRHHTDRLMPLYRENSRDQPGETPSKEACVMSSAECSLFVLGLAYDLARSYRLCQNDTSSGPLDMYICRRS